MYIKKFQAGGMAPEAAPVEAAPVEAEAPVQGEQMGAEEQLAQIAQQLLQMLLQELGDPNAVAAVLQMCMEMLAQAAQPSAQEAPVFRRGGTIAKNRCGSKIKTKK